MKNENHKAITANQFKSLNDLYNFYNNKLFNGELSQCIINLSRKAKSRGFFAPCRWIGEKEGDIRHEISINPDHMDRPDLEWHSTLVHEMCHLWQYDIGKPNTKYHDLQFAEKMEEVGLITSNTGEEGGKRIGARITHYILSDGKFENAFLDLVQDEYYKKRQFYKPHIIGLDTPKMNKNGNMGTDGDKDGDGSVIKVKTKNKNKYSCSCGTNIWGKPELSIKCNKCNQDFEEQ